MVGLIFRMTILYDHSRGPFTLGGKVRSLRTYEIELDEQAESSWQERKN